MGFRFLLLLAALAALYLVTRKLLRAGRRPRANQSKPAAEDMVRCALCGVHVPRSQSVERLGRHFCSAQHLQAFREGA